MQAVKTEARKISREGVPRMSWRELNRYIEEARKDPEFMKEVEEFIRKTTS